MHKLKQSVYIAFQWIIIYILFCSSHKTSRLQKSHADSCYDIWCLYLFIYALLMMISWKEHSTKPQLNNIRVNKRWEKNVYHSAKLLLSTKVGKKTKTKKKHTLCVFVVMRWAGDQQTQSQTQMKLCGLNLSNKSLSLVSSQSRPADKQALPSADLQSMFWAEIHASTRYFQSPLTQTNKCWREISEKSARETQNFL